VIGNLNWNGAANLDYLELKFTNADAIIGNNNWQGLKLLKRIDISCPASVWVGSNNFSQILDDPEVEFYIDNSVFGEYDSVWKAAQGVPASPLFFSV